MISDRLQRQTVHFDQWTGQPVMHIQFSDYHPVKKAVSYGIALHEGALFGVANQVLATLLVLTLLFMTVSAAVMWQHRRPAGEMGWPERGDSSALPKWLLLVAVLLAVLLPLLAASLLLIAAIDLLRSRLAG